MAKVDLKSAYRSVRIDRASQRKLMHVYIYISAIVFSMVFDWIVYYLH